MAEDEPEERADRDEMRRMIEQREREFLDNGPEELRWIREKMVEFRRVAPKAILDKHRAHATGDPKKIEEADALYEKTKALAQELDDEYRSRMTVIELRQVPEEKRPAALELLQQRDAQILRLERACHATAEQAISNGEEIRRIRAEFAQKIANL